MIQCLEELLREARLRADQASQDDLDNPGNLVAARLDPARGSQDERDELLAWYGGGPPPTELALAKLHRGDGE